MIWDAPGTDRAKRSSAREMPKTIRGTAAPPDASGGGPCPYEERVGTSGGAEGGAVGRPIIGEGTGDPISRAYFVLRDAAPEGFFGPTTLMPEAVLRLTGGPPPSFPSAVKPLLAIL